MYISYTGYIQMKNGKFIVLEGLDGSGKTEVINRLKKDFPEFIYTREPGGSVFGEMVRNVLLDEKSKKVPPLPMLLGFMTSRASHVEELVLSNIKKGKNVISDRFDTSTFTFQLFGQENRKLEDIFWFLRKKILKNLSVYYIYLRITPEIAQKRRENREGNNHFDNQTSKYHKRVFSGYEHFFKKIKMRTKIIDASFDKETVYKNVSLHIQKIIKK